MNTTTTSRRDWLAGIGLATIGALLRPRTALAQVSVAKRSENGDVLVTIFLRGGADGLSVVVPHGEDAYYKNRPTLALASPRDRRVGAANRVIELNALFGLHPALASLRPLYERAEMAIVPACGSGDQTRSHFEAAATMERGIYGAAGPASGWIARYLEQTGGHSISPLRAVALGPMLPDALRGTTGAMALETVEELRLQVPFATREGAVKKSLARLYAGSHDAFDLAGTETLSVLRTLEKTPLSNYKPSGGAIYPKDGLGNGLRQVALLMKSDVGLEAACLDQNGYDTHVAQGTSQGAMAGLLRSLGDGIAAFATDLGPERWARTKVVVLSEFGRRLEENSGGGTDHGRGGVLFVLGGKGVNGGKIHGVWPGLKREQLEGPGDVRVTTDYRCVLAELVARRVGEKRIADVFPGLAYRPVGVLHG